MLAILFRPHRVNYERSTGQWFSRVSIMHRHNTREGHWACSVNRFVITALLNWSWSLWLHYKAINYINPSEWAIDFCHELWVQMDNISTIAVCHIHTITASVLELVWKKYQVSFTCCIDEKAGTLKAIYLWMVLMATSSVMESFCRKR